MRTSDHWQATADGRVIDRSGATVALCYQLPLDPVPAATKAGFIARACNTHGAMLEALEQARAALPDAWFAVQCNVPTEVITLIDRAIAAAKAAPP